MRRATTNLLMVLGWVGALGGLALVGWIAATDPSDVSGLAVGGLLVVLGAICAGLAVQIGALRDLAETLRVSIDAADRAAPALAQRDAARTIPVPAMRPVDVQPPDVPPPPASEPGDAAPGDRPRLRAVRPDDGKRPHPIFAARPPK